MTRLILSVVFAALLILGAQTASAAASAKPDLSKVVLYGSNSRYSSGLKGRLLVNGVEIERFEGKSGSRSGGTIQTWLMPGVNVFELEITEAPSGDEPKPWYKFSLHGLVKPGFPEDENRIFAFAWPESDKDAKQTKKRFEYKVVAAPPSEVWTKAEKLAQLDAAAQTALRARVKELQDAFRAKDAARIVELRRFNFEDGQRLFRREIPKDLSAMVDMLKEELADKTLVLTYTDPAALRFELVAGGRLVKVTGPKGEPPIQGTAKEASMEVLPYFASFGGVWTLAR